MPERSGDWFRHQAEADFRHARHALEDGDFEWAAFAAHQAAEIAIKAVFQRHNLDAWGHTVSALLGRLPEAVRTDEGLVDRAKELDKHYIPTVARTPSNRAPRSTSTHAGRPIAQLHMRRPSLSSVVVKSIGCRSEIDAHQAALRGWKGKTLSTGVTSVR